MGKNGIVTETVKEKDNSTYHDIIALFGIYRSVTWQMQSKILQVKRRFQNEYGTDVDSFLESIYEAGMDLNDDDANIKLKIEAIRSSNNYLKLIDDAVEVMRRYHPKGEKYYWVLYYTYLSPYQADNVSEILDKLEPHFPQLAKINRATYFRWKNDAFKAVGNILWGYEDDSRKVLEYFQNHWMLDEE